MVDEAVLGADYLGDRRLDELGITQRAERDPPDAVLVVAHELGRSLQREARLAGAAGAGQCHEPGLVE